MEPIGIFLERFSANDVARLAPCCKGLDARVKALGYEFWTKQISRIKNSIFNTNIVVEWLNETKDAKLARICYIALNFLGLRCNFSLGHLKAESINILPAPMLCSWLLHNINSNWILKYAISNELLYQVWAVTPMSDKKRFLEYSEETVLKCALEYICDKNAEVFAEYTFEKVNKAEIKNLFLALLRIKKYEEIQRLLKIFPSKEILDDLFLECCTHLQGVKLLIQAGAKPGNIPSLLHHAFCFLYFHWSDEMKEILILLIENGASVTARDEKGRTPLEFHIHGSNINAFVLEYLGSHGDLQTIKNNVFLILEKDGSDAIPRILYEFGAYIPGQKNKKTENTALHISHMNYVRRLLEIGEKPNELNGVQRTPVFCQIERCSTGKEIYSLLTLFKEFGADFSSDTTLLQLICERNLPQSGKAIRFLIENGLQVNALKLQGYFEVNTLDEIIEALLDGGASLSTITEDYFRFYIACKFGKLKEIENWPYDLPRGLTFSYSLTEEEEDIFKTKMMMLTPVMAAIMKGHIEVVKYLINKTNNRCLLDNPVRKAYQFKLIMQLKDPIIKNEILNQLIKNFVDRSISTDFIIDTTSTHLLLELIAQNYAEIFIEIMGKLPQSVRNEFLKENQGNIISYVIKSCNKDNLESFEAILKIIPNQYYIERYVPLFKFASSEDAGIIIPKLLLNHPRWIFHRYGDHNLFEYICFKLASNKKKQTHYLVLFHLLEEISQNYNDEDKKAIYGCALRELFNGLSKNHSCFFKLSEEHRCKVYDILFTKHQIKAGFHLLDEDALSSIYMAFGKMCPSQAQWEEVKSRLIRLEINNIKIELFGFHYVSQENKNISFERLEVLRDMIRFAWKHGGKQRIRDGEPSPLHYAVDIQKSKNIKLSLALVDELIKLGHPLDYRSYDGNTPLHCAIECDNYEAALRLIDAGASYEIKNKKGVTPKHLALDKKNLLLLVKMSKSSEILNYRRE